MGMLEVHRQNRSRVVGAGLRFNHIATETHGTVVGVVDLAAESHWAVEDEGSISIGSVT